MYEILIRLVVWLLSVDAVVYRLANENDTQVFLLSSTLMLRSPSLAHVSTR